METRSAKLSYTVAQELYNGTNESLKTLALETYPELGMSIMDKCKSFEDVLNLSGEDPSQFVITPSDSYIQRTMKIDGKMTLIYKVLNENHVYDWTDSNPKWRVWYCLNKFSFNRSGYNFSGSVVSARLCLKSEELCKHLVKHFEKELKDYFYQ